MGCIRKLRRNRGVQVFVFLIILAIDLADMINDWLFYTDMRDQEKGLVFGPIDSKLLYAILAFSIIGVVTFTVELIFFGREIFCPDNMPLVDSDYFSTITIWVEEVPQITISVYIASCREEAVSIFQILKASVVMIGCLLRFIIAVVRQCLCKRKAKYGNEKVFKVCSGFLFSGSMLLIIGSSLVFVFSHVLREGGKISFREPKEFITIKRDTSKYYPNVGIYLDSHMLQNDNNAKSNEEWIKLIDLTEIEKNLCPAIRIKFNRNGEKKIHIQTILNRVSAPQDVLKVECYRKSQWDVSQTNQCSNLFDPSEPTSEIVIYFKFIPQSSHVIMGDVQYNTLYTSSGKCLNGAGYYTLLDLMYFKAKSLEEDTFSKYYKSDDLVSIKEAWKTGFMACKSSGSQGPHWNKNIPVQCLNI